MATNPNFEEELEKQEQKHKKIVKYDMEILIAFFVVLIIIIIENFFLKANYKAVGEAKSGLAPAIIECNKSILNAAETYRKNSGESNAVAIVDAAKMSFDTAIGYCGKTLPMKGTKEGRIVDVLDSCYMTAFRFHNVLESQKNLHEAGVTVSMINNMDKDINRLKENIDSLVAGIESYNSSGFCLKFSWVTPYPGTIEYRHFPLPEVQPFVDTVAAVKPNVK